LKQIERQETKVNGIVDYRVNNPLLDQSQFDKRQTITEIVQAYPKVRYIKEFVIRTKSRHGNATFENPTESLSPERSYRSREKSPEHTEFS
jgi:hypothetical protein